MKIKFLLVTAVLATAILCSAGFVSAQTTDNSALIAQLQAQIAQLTAQLQAIIAQQGGQGQVWCHTFNTNLREGDNNNEVSALETALDKEFNYESRPGNTSFDDYIASHVVQFQEKYASDILTPNGLKHGTGFVGVSTRSKLNALYGCGIVPPPVNQCTKDSDCPIKTIACAPGMVCPSPKCVSGQCVTTPPYPTTCTPNWQCVAGPCVNGYSFSSPKDVNNCNVSIIGQTLPSCPSTATSCTSNNQASIKVTSPNGGESYTLGSTMPITWSSSKLNVGQVAIMIYRYDDNLNQGKPVAVSAFAPILVSNTGSYTLTIPSGSDVNTTLACSNGCSTNGAMFKVVIYYPDLVSGTVDQYLTSGVADASDNYFSITGSNNSQCTSLYWIDNITQNCSQQKQFCGSYMYQGLQTFTSQLNCQIAVLQKQLNKSCNTNSDCLSGQVCNSGVCGTATQPSITINSPAGGQTYNIGSAIPVTFTTSGLAGAQIQPVLINTSTGQSVYGFPTITNSSDDTQTINESIPSIVPAGNNYAIKVIGMPTNPNCNISSPGCIPTATSTGSFSIVVSTACANLYWIDNTTQNCSSQKQFCGTYMYQGLQTFSNQQDCQVAVLQRQLNQMPTITVTSPNGGESWTQGETHNITWTSSNLPSSSVVNVKLFTTCSGTPAQAVAWSYNGTLASNVSASAGSYSWTIPTNIPACTNSYKIQVITSDGATSGLSSNYFSIAAPTATAAPTGVSISAGAYMGTMSQGPTVTVPVGTTLVNLNWTSTGATSCSIVGSPVGVGNGTNLPPFNSSGNTFVVDARNSNTYTVTCSNSVGSATNSVTVNIAAQ